jgi:hypothetical protein
MKNCISANRPLSLFNRFGVVLTSLFIVCLSSIAFGQVQPSSGTNEVTAPSNNLNIIDKTGFYYVDGNTTQGNGSTPPAVATAPFHAINGRYSVNGVINNLQIGSSINADNSLFFRKNPGTTPGAWYELATRNGSNLFTSAQTFQSFLLFRDVNNTQIGKITSNNPGTAGGGLQFWGQDNRIALKIGSAGIESNKTFTMNTADFLGSQQFAGDNGFTYQDVRGSGPWNLRRVNGSDFKSALTINPDGNAGFGYSLGVGGNLNVNGNLSAQNINTRSSIGIAGTTNFLEFGQGIAKDPNAGKICYGCFTPDALNIVGAGTSGANRKIQFYNEGGAFFTGQIATTAITSNNFDNTGSQIFSGDGGFNYQDVRGGATWQLRRVNGNDFKTAILVDGGGNTAFGYNVQVNGNFVTNGKLTAATGNTNPNAENLLVNGRIRVLGNEAGIWYGGASDNGNNTWFTGRRGNDNKLRFFYNGERATLSETGKFNCTEVLVTATVADYVFEPEYKLPTLAETEAYIKEHKHLPGVPGKAEVEKDGFQVGLMTNKVLEKVEELTLHLIALEKQVAEQKAEITRLKKRKK